MTISHLGDDGREGDQGVWTLEDSEPAVIALPLQHLLISPGQEEALGLQLLG